MSRLKSTYRTAKLAWTFVMREERKTPTTVSLARRIAFLRKGFLSQAADLYNLRDYRLDDYFSDWAKARMSMMYDGRNVRAGYQYGLNNKLFSTAILGQYLRVPKVYVVIEHGCAVRLDGERRMSGKSAWTDLCSEAGGALVIKPLAGSCGRGVFFISLQDGVLHVNGNKTDERQLVEIVSSLNEYIAVEMMRQGQFASSLYPHSTNTIRIVTMIDPSSGEPYLPMAVQRIGREASKPVDNWFQSGLSAEVDRETGILSRAASRETKHRTLMWNDVHPDTGAPIRGVRVPDWAQIKETILNVAGRMAFFKFMSWDVVTLDDGIAVLEADTVSAIDLLQVHRPLLRDERLRRFLEHYHYVKPAHGKQPRGGAVEAAGAA